MSIYIGLIVNHPLQNKVRFQDTINEIKHFVQAYENEVICEISKTLITIKPKQGGIDASFPMSHNYLHTTFFRISYGDERPSDDIKLFAYVVWECCCIFKENFPSKIELFQENLDLCSSVVRNFSTDEILRRQISSLNSKKYSKEMIKADEVDDIFCILDLSYKKKNAKGMLVCLEILNSQSLCPTAYLKNIPESYIKLVENIASLKQSFLESSFYDEENLAKDSSANKTLASSLLVRITNASRSEEETEYGYQPFKPFGESNGVDERRFERPGSLKTCLFQLSESNDIDRIVFLLEDILSTHLSKLDYLVNSNFPKILTKIIFRYANGDFGFENNDNTKYCIFQNRLMKSLLTLVNHNPNMIFEINPETLNALAQIIEECCMYIIENISNSDKKYEHEYQTTFTESLELFEQLLTNHSMENISEVISAVKNVIQRINMYFSQQAEEDCDTEELGVFNDDLKAYYKDLKKLLVKTETLANIYDPQKGKSKILSYSNFNKENLLK